MQTVLVVELDVADHFVPEFVVGLECHLEQPLDFEGMEEGLDVGVVVDVRRAVHALHEAMLTQLGFEFKSRELDTPIRVEVHALAGTSVSHGVLQSGDGQLRCSVVGHAPANDAPGEAIDDDGQVTPSTGDLEVRDIAMPDLIGACDLHVENAVGYLVMELQVRALAHKQVVGSALQPSLAHEARHAMAAYQHPPLAQLLHDARRAIHAAPLLMCLVDQLRQLLVANAALADRADPPSVKARTGDSHELAHHRERERLTVCFDEGEDEAFVSEANRMAFFRMSCSN